MLFLFLYGVSTGEKFCQFLNLWKCLYFFILETFFCIKNSRWVHIFLALNIHNSTVFWVSSFRFIILSLKSYEWMFDSLLEGMSLLVTVVWYLSSDLKLLIHFFQNIHFEILSLWVIRTQKLELILRQKIWMLIIFSI